MARIRSIKPEFWDSPDTARASLRARLFYIAMWNWADDYGKGTASPKQLVGFAFPNDDEITVADYPSLAQEVAECFGVVFYTADRRPYYAIPSFSEHQRTEKRAQSRIPDPPGDVSAGQPPCDGATADSDGPSDTVDGSSGVGTGEQGNRGKGTGEQGKSAALRDAAAPTTAIAIAARQDVIRLCEHLADRIEANGSKRPSIGKGWHDAARLMLDNDGRNEQQVHAAIDWCQTDEFWRATVLSMPKLREKYDTLRLQAQRGAAPRSSGDIDWEAAMARAKARDERNEATG